MKGFESIVGQSVLKTLLRPKIRLCKQVGVAFPHLMLCAESENGKAVFAAALAEELEVPFTSYTAESINRPQQLTEVFSKIGLHKVLAVRNVEHLRPSILNMLTAAVSTFRVDITIGSDSYSRTVSLPIPQFTFVGTTAKPWLVTEELRAWCTVCQLAPYTHDEAAEIVLRIATKNRLPLSAGAAAALAVHCNGKPDRAAMFIQRVMNHFSFDGGKTTVDEGVLRTVIEFFGSGDYYPEALTVADRVTRMDGIAFEGWTAELFRKAGFSVEFTKASGDHGIDLCVRYQGQFLAIQCKRWNGTIGEPVLRDFYGAIIAAGADAGCVVTTATFSSQAREFSKGKPLHLIGLEQLIEAVNSPEVLNNLFSARLAARGLRGKGHEGLR